jgi:deoxyribose-phosphate aldolase
VAKAPALPGGFELPLEPRLPRIGSIDAVALEERAATLAKRSIKRESKMQALELAVRMMDLTTLEGQDTPGKVAALCSKAIRPDPVDPTVPSVAAICVYPNLVATAKSRLEGSGVKVAAVATAFPSGQSPTEIKVAEARAVVELGADEVDMVIDRGAFLSGRYAKVYDEIVRVKEASGDAHHVFTETGRVIGIKPAGGIRTSKQAVQYLVVLHETLGTEWLTPDLFRFGASSLLNDVLMQIRKEKTGQYQSLDYFTND